MKKFYIWTIIFLFSFISNSYSNNEANVIASITPIHSLVKAILGDTRTVDLIVPQNSSPHITSLKPSQLKKLNNADIIFFIDDEFETFLAKPFKTLTKNTKRVALSKSPNIKLLENRHLNDFKLSGHEKHNHEDSHHDCPGCGNHHDEPSDHNHHEHHGTDYHIWLNPKNAINMLETIKDVLSKTYPEHKKIFTDNYNNYVAKINILDKKITLDLKTLEKTPYLVFHDAYQYFEKKYNLTPVGTIAINPSIPPSIKHIDKLRKIAKKTNAKCYFSEPQFSSKWSELFSKNSEIKTSQLDPLGKTIDLGPDLYISLLENISKSFKACLK